MKKNKFYCVDNLLIFFLSASSDFTIPFRINSLDGIVWVISHRATSSVEVFWASAHCSALPRIVLSHHDLTFDACVTSAFLIIAQCTAELYIHVY